MRKLYQAGLILLVMALVAACGSVATPRYEADRIIAEAEEEATRIVEAAHSDESEAESQTVAEEPTEVPTEIPPTEVPTEIPPTEIPPTAIPTEIPPTEIPPTEAPTEEEASAEGIEAELMAAVAEADASAGEAKFLATGCTGCHQTTDLQIVGPGLANVFNHAEERGTGQGAYEYVFTSIRNSQAFIVEGFTAGLMPQYTEDQLSDQDIYNLMAYLEQFSN